MIIIANDDPVYLSWVRRHRDGYVVDTKRKPTRQNTTLHLAACSQIRRSKKNKPRHWTTGTRLKACSMDRDELVEWVHQQLDGEPRLCEDCLQASDEVTPGGESLAADDRHLTKLGAEIVSLLLESAVIHLDHDLPYQTTIADVALHLGKSPAQLAGAIERLTTDGLVEIEGDVDSGDTAWTKQRIFPTAASLTTLPAFAALAAKEVEEELSSLHAQTSDRP